MSQPHTIGSVPGLTEAIEKHNAAHASPTGTPVIPPAAVPYVLAGASLLQIVGEEVADPAPWTLARGIGLGVKVLGFLALGASPGLRRK
jgi:hypothetical protein